MSGICDIHKKNTVLSKIRLIAPEFKGVPDNTLEELIDLFSPLVSKKQFGNLYDLALAYIVCHKMKMDGMGEDPFGGAFGESGSIGAAYAASSVSDGGSSISFAAAGVGNTQVDAEYSMTVYGTQFLQIRRMAVIPIHVSGEGDVCVRV